MQVHCPGVDRPIYQGGLGGGRWMVGGGAMCHASRLLLCLARLCLSNHSVQAGKPQIPIAGADSLGATGIA